MSNTAELGEEVVRALHGTAHTAQPARTLPSIRGTQAEATVVGPLPGRPVPVGTIGLRRGPAARIYILGRLLGFGRAEDQGFEQILGLAPFIGVGSGDERAQRHGSRIGGQVQCGAALAPVYGAGARLLPPFFAGFLEPSSRT